MKARRPACEAKKGTNGSSVSQACLAKAARRQAGSVDRVLGTLPTHEVPAVLQRPLFAHGCQRAGLLTEGVLGRIAHLRAGGLNGPVENLLLQTILRRDVRPRAVGRLVASGASLPASFKGGCNADRGRDGDVDEA